VDNVLRRRWYLQFRVATEHRQQFLTQATTTTLAAAVVAVFTLIASASFAALIFSGRLAPYAAHGFSMALVTAVIVGLVVAWRSSCRVAIAIPQDRVAPLLTMLAGSVAGGMSAAPPDQVFASVISSIVLVTLVTGVVLYGLGRLKLGNLVRYIPYPVIGGFLAGSGWLLVLGGLRVMLGHKVELRGLIDPEALKHILPGVLLGVLLLVVFKRARHPFITPVLLLGSIGIFYLVLAVSGVGLPEARAGGWLPNFLAQDNGVPLNPFASTNLAAWFGLLHHANLLATILLTSIVSILLTATALELTGQQEVDFNRELCAAGMGSFFAGLAGGMVGFHSLSLSRLAHSMGARSRWTGVLAAVFCGLAIFGGAFVAGLVPQFVCGGLLFFLGLVFLWEWVYEAALKLTRLDYCVVLLILGVVGTVGYPEGVASGIVAAVVLFIHNYSRVDVVSRAHSGADLRSNVERPVNELRWLREHGDQIFVLRLQGFIFFGTATHLLHQVRDRTRDAARPKVRFVVMDFRQVTGLDSSAVFSLWKAHQLARKFGFTLLMTQVNPEIERQLNLGGLRATAQASFRLMQDLDHGLEWCENHLLTHPDLDRSGAAGQLQEQLKDLWPASISPEHLFSFLQPATVSAGAHLIRQNDPSDCLYFIESGNVTVRLELDGGRHIRLRSMGAGTVVGEMGLILGSKRGADVVAESACSVYRLDQAALDRMHLENPPLALALHQYLVKLLAERLTTTSNMLRGMH